jgi:hypothetical protein
VGTDAAALLLEVARSRPPTLGSGRLVCIDGPAGSGKTTLAAAVAARAPGSTLVHLDDLYDGWDGLPGVGAQLDTLLLPLARGEAGRYRRYDWHAGRFAETVQVAPTALLVLEGVGAGSPAHAGLATVTAWVSAAQGLRRARGVARDGATLAAHWSAWAAAEADHFARSDVAARADLLVDGSGATPPRLRIP